MTQSEFAARVELRFDSDEEGEEYEPDDIVEWGAFGFLFTVGVLSFADARPREASIIEYAEKGTNRHRAVIEVPRRAARFSR